MTRLVLVEWLDSDGNGGWRSIDDATREAAGDPLTCESAGWILEETDRYLLLAAARSTGRRVELVADTTQIPRVAIVAVRELKPGRAV